MSNFAQRYRTDPVLEEEGVWIDLGEGIKIRVARTRSKAAKTALMRLHRPYESLRQSGRGLPEALQDKLTKQWVAEAILRDWQGVTDAAGKTLTFSPETALQVFEAFPDFLDEVVFFANQQETFRAEALEATEGN